MKFSIKLLCLLIASLTCLTVFASCGKKNGSENESKDDVNNQTNSEATQEGEDETLTDGVVENVGKYNTSYTGSGKNINMILVGREIGSMQVSDFIACEGESDYVLIKIKNYGEIVVVLREDVAPQTVANFKSLVSNDFYTDTIFHRVMKNFMIQGGGYVVKDGVWASKKTDSIKGEFTQNGHVNNLDHVRGVISMARTVIPDSATSQFFIMHSNTSSLDGKYASFGYVLAGLDVVDAIATCKVEGDANAPSPVEDVVIESMSFVIPK